MDPNNILENRRLVELGENTLMIVRVGYRVAYSKGRTVETGLTIQAPLGGPFQEFAGAPLPPSLQVNQASDFGGEMLTRLAWFYLKGSL
jgi:hypothetical protein